MAVDPPGDYHCKGEVRSLLLLDFLYQVPAVLEKLLLPDDHIQGRELALEIDRSGGMNEVGDQQISCRAAAKNWRLQAPRQVPPIPRTWEILVVPIGG